MDETTFEGLQPDVKTAAKITAREWADVIDEDDAEQEIWLRLLESSSQYGDRVAELEKSARVSVLTEIGHQIGMKYRDDYELFSGNHTYGTRQVRDMLERGALAGAQQGVPIWELPESVISQLERTDTETATERIDLFIGMGRLVKRNSSYADLLIQVYVNGWEPSDGTERKKLTRAVDALTREMNNTHRRRVADYLEGPGTRKVISNAEAQMITRGDYGNPNGRTHSLMRTF